METIKTIWLIATLASLAGVALVAFIAVLVVLLTTPASSEQGMRTEPHREDDPSCKCSECMIFWYETHGDPTH